MTTKNIFRTLAFVGAFAFAAASTAQASATFSSYCPGDSDTPDGPTSFCPGDSDTPDGPTSFCPGGGDEPTEPTT